MDRFLIATTHMGINVRRLVEGFILPANKAETLAYLYDIHQPLNIVKQYLWVFNVRASEAPHIVILTSTLRMCLLTE